jgi:hypothetical protein
MVWAGSWQWGVAFSEIGADGQPALNPRNLVYAIQWWVFAAFGTWFWFRFLRDQRDAELVELEAAANAAAEQTHDMSGVGSKGPVDGREAAELISLDDSLDQRRARARGLSDTSAHDGEAIETSADLGSEGKLP